VSILYWCGLPCTSIDAFCYSVGHVYFGSYLVIIILNYLHSDVQRNVCCSHVVSVYSDTCLLTSGCLLWDITGHWIILYQYWWLSVNVVVAACWSTLLLLVLSFSCVNCHSQIYVAQTRLSGLKMAGVLLEPVHSYTAFFFQVDILI